MSRTLRVGIVGVNPDGGWAALAHMPALHALDHVELTAVCNRHAERARDAAAKFHAPKAFSDVSAMLADPDIDLISICVRVPHHFELVTAALEAGKHVYCEWPLAVTTAQAKALRDHATRRGLRHAIGLQARFSPVLAHVKMLIETGAIGEVLSCTAIHSWPHTTSSAYLQDDMGGATLLDIPGGHTLDAIQYMLGGFSELSALSRTSIKKVKIDKTGEIVERTSPDQIAIHGTLQSSAIAVLQFKTGPSPGTGFRLEINGTKKDLVLTSVGYPPVQMTELTLWETKDGQISKITLPSESSPLQKLPTGRPNNIGRLYAALAMSIADGTPFTPDFGTAVINHKLLDVVREAAKSGSRVLVPAH